MKKNEKKVGEIVVDTLIKSTLLELEEEDFGHSDFDVLFEVEQSGEKEVMISGSARVNFNRIPNYIDGVIESYEREYLWEGFIININDYTDVKQARKTIRVELEYFLDLFTANVKNK